MPVFPTKTPEAFIRLMQVVKRGSMSLRDKWSVLRKDPEFRTLPTILKQLKTPASFVKERFNALHSYYLINEEGKRQAVRFSWYPVLDGAHTEPQVKNRNDLEAELLHRLENEKVRFYLMIQLAEDGDPVDDSSIQCPENRTLIDKGVLTLTEVRDDGAESLMFDPTIEVDGLELSDDPILRYRSLLYKESADRRSSENLD